MQHNIYVWMYINSRHAFSHSHSHHRAWQAVVRGSVLTLKSLFALPVMPSLTWQRANSISSEFCLPISTETVSHQSRLDLSRLWNSKVCFCPLLCIVTQINRFSTTVEYNHTLAAVVFMIFYLSFLWFIVHFYICCFIFVVFRCAICSRSGDCYQGNRHLRPHPVGSSKGT